jgi:CRP-like cAMP-binding protein
MRLEVCNLVEYIHCPPGCTLFEEGDRVDFCYLVLQGRVSFTKYDEKTRRVEDLGTKGTGVVSLRCMCGSPSE